MVHVRMNVCVCVLCENKNVSGTGKLFFFSQFIKHYIFKGRGKHYYEVQYTKKLNFSLSVCLSSLLSLILNNHYGTVLSPSSFD